MRVLTLDIETSLSEPYDEIDPKPRRGDGGGVTWEPESRFAPLPLHVPEVIAYLVSDHGELHMHVYDAAKDDEYDGLFKIAEQIEGQGCDRLVTFNGRAFDMPLLSLRALKHGVDWSWWESKRHRFPNYRKPLFHYDLMDQLSDYGAARGLSLDRVARLVGAVGKRDIRGCNVPGLLAEGRRDEVIAYCCDDVFQTWLVYLAFCHSHLRARDAQAEALIHDSLTWAGSHEYLSRFYGGGGPYAEGVDAALGGGNEADNPYPIPSDEHLRWNDGYDSAREGAMAKRARPPFSARPSWPIKGPASWVDNES